MDVCGLAESSLRIAVVRNRPNELKHAIDWDNLSMLEKGESQIDRRRIQDRVHIHLSPNIFNLRDQQREIAATWFQLFEQ